MHETPTHRHRAVAEIGDAGRKAGAEEAVLQRAIVQLHGRGNAGAGCTCGVPVLGLAALAGVLRAWRLARTRAAVVRFFVEEL